MPPNSTMTTDRMSLNDGDYIGHRIFGGGAAGAPVLDLVVVATLVEVALQCVRERPGRAGVRNRP